MKGKTEYRKLTNPVGEVVASPEIVGPAKTADSSALNQRNRKTDFGAHVLSRLMGVIDSS